MYSTLIQSQELFFTLWFEVKVVWFAVISLSVLTFRTSRCLPSCTTLVSLNLSGNPSVTSAGLHNILNSLREARRPLTLLNLQGTCVCIHHTQRLDSQAMFQSNCKSPLCCIPPSSNCPHSDPVTPLIIHASKFNWIRVWYIIDVYFIKGVPPRSFCFRRCKRKTSGRIKHSLWIPASRFAFRLSGVRPLGHRRPWRIVRACPGSPSLLPGTQQAGSGGPEAELGQRPVMWAPHGPKQQVPAVRCGPLMKREQWNETIFIMTLNLSQVTFIMMVLLSFFFFFFFKVVISKQWSLEAMQLKQGHSV